MASSTSGLLGETSGRGGLRDLIRNRLEQREALRDLLMDRLERRQELRDMLLDRLESRGSMRGSIGDRTNRESLRELLSSNAYNSEEPAMDRQDVRDLILDQAENSSRLRQVLNQLRDEVGGKRQ